MTNRLYNLLIGPRQRDEDIRNREVVLNALLAGTLCIALLALLLLVGKIIFLGATFLYLRALVVMAVVLFIVTLYKLSRRGWLKTTSYLLVSIYFLLATALIYQWGLNVPTGILLYGLVIVLAGILLGPTYSLYAAGGVALTLTAFVLSSERGLISPDWSWTMSQPTMVDVTGFSLIFIVIALVCWLFNKQMARSLYKAEKAEAALTKQKDLLETTVEERTQELQAVQLEKIQQMYRFAELGQLSTALLHDLANHLTTLTLDIEGLQGQSRSRALSRAKRSIHYIDDMVVRVGDQLHGRSQIRTFYITHEIDEMVHMLRPRAQAAHVQFVWQAPTNKKELRCSGEPIRFRQLIANLLSNAIDAYPETVDTGDKREVLVTLTGNKTSITITVNDWGRGIPVEDRLKLFQPFFSTKKTGMGMGLYIVKQVAEEHFLGSVKVDERQKHTAFVVTLPRAGT